MLLTPIFQIEYIAYPFSKQKNQWVPSLESLFSFVFEKRMFSC